MLNTPLKPMLLQPSTTIPQGDYISQIKLDGHRTLLHYDHGKIKVYTRHMNDVTNRYILNFIWANYKYISIPWLILNLAHLICAK